MRLPTRKAELFRQQTQSHDPHITADKARRLQRTLKRLKDIEHPAAVKETQETGAMGDFSENAEYQYAKAKLRRINASITRIEEQLKTAIIMPEKSLDGSVHLGTTVTVAVDQKTQSLKLVGESEANPFKGCISSHAPLGKALLGKRVGDEVVVTTPVGTKTYTILSVT